MPGYADGDSVPPNTQCDAFICRRQLTDTIASELKQREKDSKTKTSQEIRGALTSICDKIGLLVYTEIEECGALRASGFWASKESEERSMMEYAKRRAEQRKLKEINRPSE
jgi:hypothetical protein